ncbi:helix-turn-helix transcriptional regulator [Nocardia farcinica]|uniref:helix-turn-helix domain-containing protein n=1 Tax=Nocardia farcinica TaxID=37329 RepID=UPI001894B0A4|nr:helix-turn-helix transcriptional regulator [Nocardia farcinica]MBF6259855.1 helix-turn-helix transcriptional regulator [Nocardia farcinica]
MEKKQMGASRTREAKKIGSIIKKRRGQLKLTRSDLARRTGLTPSTIQRLEDGIFAHPSPRSLQAIADGLELPVDTLLAEAGWLPKTVRPTLRPHLSITYYCIPAEISREIQRAIDRIIKRRAATFDTYHQSVTREDDIAA